MASIVPVRFRHLKEASFSRWDWVQFQYGRPKADRRLESCHVYEETIKTDGELPDRERSMLLEPMIVGSARRRISEAISRADPASEYALHLSRQRPR